MDKSQMPYLRERNQTQKATYIMVSFLGHSGRDNKQNIYIYKQNKLMIARGWESSEALTTKKDEGMFWGDRNVLHFDPGADFNCMHL